jgi:hypothetical protein
MYDVSVFRLNLLRAMYLLIVVGLGLVLWPGILFHAGLWSSNGGAITMMLAAFSLVCVFGIRYPLQLLPILLWELIWKTMWLLMVALPAWNAGAMDEAMMARVWELSVVVLIPFVIPWRYFFRHYFSKPAEPYASAALPTTTTAP